MITNELVSYIKSSLAKGKTVEEIKNTLREQSGWNERDIAEAFSSSIWSGNKFLKIFIPVIIITLGAGSYFLFNSVNDGENRKSTENITSANQNINTEFALEKNCGVSNIEKSLVVNDFSIFKDDPVLACIGASAINCKNAKGVFYSDPNFYVPNVIEIINTGKSCEFRLSYGIESVTVSKWTHERLAGKYIQCPINVVNVIDEKENIKSDNQDGIVFKSPNTRNAGEYAYQISYYGSAFISLFKNELDFKKIGCSGDLIKQYIASNSSISSKYLDEATQERNQTLSDLQMEASYYFSNNKNSYKDMCKQDNIIQFYIDKLKSKNSIDIKCIDSVNNYAISVDSHNATFICIDNTGFNGSINKNITNPECK